MKKLYEAERREFYRTWDALEEEDRERLYRYLQERYKVALDEREEGYTPTYPPTSR